MIWLVGNKGMLGTAVEALLKKSGTMYLASDREVDITDEEAIEAFLREHLEIVPGKSGRAAAPSSATSVGSDESGSRLERIINCAAYTEVDQAEENARAAGRLNSAGPKNLAHAARQHDAGLIHVSTDYVFDGTKKAGYHENDPQGAVSVYGRTKWAGEEAIQRSGASHHIVRTAWLFGEHGPNFVATMLSRFIEGNPVRVVNDQWGSPTYAGDLAEALVRLAGVQVPWQGPGTGSTLPMGGHPATTTGETDGNHSHPAGKTSVPPQGFYHFTNRGRINWYDFALEIFAQAREMGLCPEGSTITPVPSSEYPTKARRPVYSFLHTDRIREALGMEIRSYQEALSSYLTSIQHERKNI